MTALVDECGDGPAGGGMPPSGHPLLGALAQMEAVLDEVADVGCWSLSDAEVARMVARASVLRSRVDEVWLRLVAAADSRDLSAVGAATSTAAWLRSSQRVSRRTAAAQVRLGAALGRECELTREALAAGQANAEQAAVIVAAVGRLPRAAGDQQRRACEAHLVELAATFGPEDLAVLGRRVWEAVDPAGADAAEAAALAREEAAARSVTMLQMGPAGDGSTRGRFVLPDAQAEMLRVALEALIAPRRPSHPRSDADAQPDAPQVAALDGERLSYPQRLGEAFCELIEHLPTDQLPQSGRSAPTVTVTVPLAGLVTGMGSATLSTGTSMSPGQARRLACNADLVPHVLGGDSVVLDAGRARRFYDHHQRRVLATVQRGCVADGCDRPPAWCEAHHPVAWADGGRTDVSGAHGGVLLCGRHHHLVHDDGWDVAWAPDHIPELVPPATIDPTRTPIRHRRYTRRRPP